MRKEKSDKLKSEFKNLSADFEKIEFQMASLKNESESEKEMCAAIDKIQNQKIEFIFEQVKKEIKNKNLDISSASVLTIIDALKNNQQILQTEENFETDDESEEILPEEKADKFFSQLNSFATADEMSEAK